MAYYLSAGPAGYQSSGETKSFLSNGSETKLKIFLDKTKVVSIWQITLQGNTNAVATVYKGSMNYDASGQLLGGTIKEGAVYLYNYSTQEEGNQFWRFSGAGYAFDPSAAASASFESLGASLAGFYSSNNAYNQYSDITGLTEGRNSNFPISHSRDSLATFPDGASFPVGWWNAPFNINFGSSPQNFSGLAKTADLLAFTHSPAFGRENADTIANFNPKEKDKLQIQVSQFGSDAAGTFKIAKNAKALSKVLATTTDFIYFKPAGELYYNENGATAGFGNGGVFAILEGNPAIKAANIGFI